MDSLFGNVAEDVESFPTVAEILDDPVALRRRKARRRVR